MKKERTHEEKVERLLRKIERHTSSMAAIMIFYLLLGVVGFLWWAFGQGQG